MAVDTSIITRIQKATPITFEEMDANLVHLKSGVDSSLTILETTVATALASLNSSTSQLQLTLSQTQTSLNEFKSTTNTTLGQHTTGIQSVSSDLATKYLSITERINLAVIDIQALQALTNSGGSNILQLQTAINTITDSINGINNSR